MLRRFADPLDEAHAPERLGKFEELLEAAVDMARVPDEYVISPTYDAVRPRRAGPALAGTLGSPARARRVPSSSARPSALRLPV